MPSLNYVQTAVATVEGLDSIINITVLDGLYEMASPVFIEESSCYKANGFLLMN